MHDGVLPSERERYSIWRFTKQRAYVVVFKKVTRREFVYEAVTLPIYRHSFFGD